jgi:hypothetical protein
MLRRRATLLLHLLLRLGPRVRQHVHRTIRLRRTGLPRRQHRGRPRVVWQRSGQQLGPGLRVGSLPRLGPRVVVGRTALLLRWSLAACCRRRMGLRHARLLLLGSRLLGAAHGVCGHLQRQLQHSVTV